MKKIHLAAISIAADRAMRETRGFIVKNEEVHESGRVVLLLPRDVLPGTGLVRRHISGEFLDRLFDLVNA